MHSYYYHTFIPAFRKEGILNVWRLDIFMVEVDIT